MSQGRTNALIGGGEVPAALYFYLGDTDTINHCAITQNHQSDWTPSMGSASYTPPTSNAPLQLSIFTSTGYMGEYTWFNFTELPFKPSKVGVFIQCLSNPVGEVAIGLKNDNSTYPGLTPASAKIVTGSLAANQRVSTSMLYGFVDVDPTIDLRAHPFGIWHRAVSNLTININGVALIKQ